MVKPQKHAAEGYPHGTDQKSRDGRKRTEGWFALSD